MTAIINNTNVPNQLIDCQWRKSGEKYGANGDDGLLFMTILVYFGKKTILRNKWSDTVTTKVSNWYLMLLKWIHSMDGVDDEWHFCLEESGGDGGVVFICEFYNTEVLFPWHISAFLYWMLCLQILSILFYLKNLTW